MVRFRVSWEVGRRVVDGLWGCWVCVFICGVYMVEIFERGRKSCLGGRCQESVCRAKARVRYFEYEV